ncbi:FAD-dependent oxidoreductase [Sporichthya polymorpha]|uniref:FAD-dependent oxidoreductase n=1 Tax=Sporichthya polymorpha TaxID=35751 RepID=UPI0003A87175|nr:FAD-dependent oxidoreductase [Sporichthya polymorpha]
MKISAQGSSRYPHVFSPLQVGPMTVHNRLCETTNTIGAGRLEGAPDDAFIVHHVAKAKGGMAWIGSETWLLDAPMPSEAKDEIIPGGAAMRFPLYYSPDVMTAVQRFVAAVHEAGAVAVFQLTQLNAVFGPSAVPVSGAYDWVSHPCTPDEIEHFIAAYANAAAAYHGVGVDGVELHAAHETLLHLFLSPATNRRTDEWGGSTEGRCKLLVETIKRVRATAGPGLAVGFRFTAGEARAGGFDLDEAERMIRHICREAPPDFVNFDVGHSWGDPPYVPTSFYPPALGADRAKRLRRAVNEVNEDVKVLYAGRVLTVEMAEQLLEDGACDLVGMTRASISDPEFALKAAEGREEEIRPCIGCNRCIDNSVHGTGTGLFQLQQRAMCSVNSTAGNELYWAANYAPARQQRHVVIVGAGPAGLETARVAAGRGHRVTVLEQHDHLGGQVWLAGQIPGREQFLRFVDYHQSNAARLGIDLQMNTAATADSVLALSPDVVVCATGSVPLVPPIDGADDPSVVQAWSVLDGSAPLGRRVAIVSQEDGMETVSVALKLAHAGHEVEVFHHWGGIGNALGRYTVPPVLTRLEELGVVCHSRVRVTKIGDGRLDLQSALTGRGSSVEGFDSVVLSCASRPDSALHDELRTAGFGRLYLIGAAWTPRGIQESVEHGMKVGLEV